MSRVLLILPSSTYRARDFLAAARELDIDVTVGSERRSTMSAVMGDRALTLALSNARRAANQIAEQARHTPFDAIVGVDDQGVMAAAVAAARLGLAHNPPAAVARTRDKAAMRDALAQAGVPQPRWARVTGVADGTAAAREVGFPCVVKPVSLSGSRGVIRADDHQQVRAAVRRVRAILASAGEATDGPLLVESYLAGAEVAVEGLLREERLEVLAVFDKPDALEGPYFEETLYVTPSRLPTDALAAINQATARAARALGLREGPVHAELRVDGARASVLELAARSIGGLCSRTLRFGAGLSLEQVILRHAVGRGLDDLRPQTPASGVMMIPIPCSGTLREVGGQHRARAVPGVVGLEITIASGRPVAALPEGDRYLGFLFACGADPGTVEVALRAAHARLEIHIDPPSGDTLTRRCASC